MKGSKIMIAQLPGAIIILCQACKSSYSLASLKNVFESGVLEEENTKNMQDSKHWIRDT